MLKIKEYCIYRAGRIVDTYTDDADASPECVLSHYIADMTFDDLPRPHPMDGLSVKSFDFLTPNLPENERGF